MFVLASSLSSSSLALYFALVALSLFIFSQLISPFVTFFSPECLMDERDMRIPTPPWSLGIHGKRAQLRTRLNADDDIEKIFNIYGRLGGR